MSVASTHTQTSAVRALLSNSMVELSRSERIALAVLLSIGGALSVIGSALIIYMQVSRENDPNSRRPTYHRFLLAMSLYKIVQSTWDAVGTLAVPKWSGGYGSFGNTGTCSAQGFFASLQLAELIYYAGLSVYYVVIVRYNVSDQMIVRRLEPTVHILAFLDCFILGTVGLSLKVYNPNFVPELGCWAAPLPLSCSNDPKTCQRGRYYKQYSWATYSQQFLFVTVVIVMSILLYHTVRARQRLMDRYASRDNTLMQQRTREVAIQALLLAAVCLFTNMWPITVTINFYVGASSLWSKIALFNAIVFFSSQGFFNFLVYTRPRYVRLRRRHPEFGRWGAFVRVVFVPRQRHTTVAQPVAAVDGVDPTGESSGEILRAVGTMGSLGNSVFSSPLFRMLSFSKLDAATQAQGERLTDTTAPLPEPANSSGVDNVVAAPAAHGFVDAPEESFEPVANNDANNTTGQDPWHESMSST